MSKTDHPGLIKKGQVRNPWGARGKDGNKNTRSKRHYYNVMDTLKEMGHDPIRAIIAEAIDLSLDAKIRHDANKVLTELIAPRLKSIEHISDESLEAEIKMLKNSMSDLLKDNTKEY